ncbi:DUF1104 domain-containing protein [Helicobacter muridarum]|nr:DUF1104 domain-containing protein [Helicobacter muridarum]STQ86075.1 Protein of uncharacterised function (DUF1104) [Helicobacter muridarum]
MVKIQINKKSKYNKLNIEVKSIFRIIIVLFVVICNLGFDAKFKNDNSEESIKEAIKTAVDDAVEFSLKIKKRANEMSEDVRKNFISEIKARYKENTKNISLDKLKKYEQETLKALKNKIDNMSDSAKQEYGITKEWLEKLYKEVID